MKFKVVVLLALVGSAALLSACAGTPPPPSGPTAVSLLLTYQPDVQFAPFYVGMDKGFFSKHGITLTVQHLAESDVAKQVGSGDATFGVVSGEQVLMGREAGLPIVYVYQWFQEYPVAVVSKTSAGIDDPTKLRGHSIGVPLKQGASYIGLEALLRAGGMTDADINLQVTGFTQVQTLLADKVDAVVVYTNNEPIQMEAAGAQINVIPVSDVVNLVSNGVITNEQTILQNPGLVKAFDAAFDESLHYTIDHPDEAFEISKGHVEGLNDPAVAKTQREVLTRSLELWQADRLGYGDVGAWGDMQDVLLNMGLLTRSQNLDVVFTNVFLPPASQ